MVFFKNSLRQIIRWTWAIFVGCSISFFLFYLIMGRVFDIKILGYTALGLWLLGPILFLISQKLRDNQ